MKFGLLPTYHDIFPEEDIPPYEHLRKGISSALIISISCFINAQLHLGSSLEKEKAIFIKMIERLGSIKAQAIFGQLIKFEKGILDRSIFIFPLRNTLELIEYELLNFQKDDLSEFTPEKELNVLKMLILKNTERNAEVETLVRTNKISEENDIYKFLWPANLPTFEFIKAKPFLSASYYSFQLLEFLEEKFPVHTKKFLSLNNVSTVRDFILKLTELYSNGYRKDVENYTFNFHPEFAESNSLINIMSQNARGNPAEYIEKGFNKDFKGLRENPFLKFDNGQYALTNWNFVIDKLNQGLIFSYFNQSGIASEIKYSNINGFGNFKSEIAAGFSEKIYFVQTMKEIFQDHVDSCFAEEEFSGLMNYDFYIRIENKIILFEFKSGTLSKTADYEKIKEKVDEIFYEKIVNEREGKKKRNGAVLQLLEQINKLNNDHNSFEDFNRLGIEKKRLIVFPVIVYTDPAFGMPGINKYLNKKFREKIEQLNHNFFFIEDLVMIDFEMLVKYASMFLTGKLQLHSLLYNYCREKDVLLDQYRNAQSTDSLLSIFLTFEEFLSRKKITLALSENYLFQKVSEKLKLPIG